MGRKKPEKKNWQGKKEWFHAFLMDYLILFLTWSGMFQRSFNCDTLFHLMRPETDIIGRCEGGRYLSGLTDYILYQFGLTTADHTGITVFAAVFLLAVSVWLVQWGFRGEISCDTLYGKFAYYAVTALMFCNVLFSESLMFGECALMFGLAYLFASLGIVLFTKGNYGAAFFLFLCSAMEYQVGVVYAAMILSVWIFLHNRYRITLRTVVQELVCGLITFGAGLLDMMSISILVKTGILEKAEKGAGIGDFAGKIGICAENFASLLTDCRGLLPRVWLPLLLLLLACGIVLRKFAAEKNGMAALYFLLLVAALILMIYVLPMAQISCMTYPRLVWVFYVMQSMLLLVALRCTGERGKVLMCYACCAYLAVQVMFCHIIVTNHMTSNTLDKTYVAMFCRQVEKYEAQTGIRVEKLAVANDTDCPPGYHNVSYKTDQINERALGIVTNTLVNAVSGRTFEKVPMDGEVFRTYFEGKNWDWFDAEEQIVILGDTAYWVIF